MKKLALFAVIIGAAAVVGCTTDKGTPQEQKPQGVRVSLLADIDGGSTRADITNPLKPTWDADEHIGVFSGTDLNVDFTGDISDNNKIAVFSGNLNLTVGTNTVYAYHPLFTEDILLGSYASNNNGSETPDDVVLCIPTVQFPRLKSFDPSAALLFADPLEVEYDGMNMPSMEELSFRHMTAVIKININDISGLVGGESLIVGGFGFKDGISTISAPVTGLFHADLTDPSFSITADTTVTKWQSSMPLAAAVYDVHKFAEIMGLIGADDELPEGYTDIDFPTDGSQSIYLCVTPGTIPAGITITFHFITETYIFSKDVTLTKDYDAQAGKINTMNVTLTAADEVQHSFERVTDAADAISRMNWLFPNTFLIAAVDPDEGIVTTDKISFDTLNYWGSTDVAQPYYNVGSDTFKILSYQFKSVEPYTGVTIGSYLFTGSGYYMQYKSDADGTNYEIYPPAGWGGMLSFGGENKWNFKDGMLSSGSGDPYLIIYYDKTVWNWDKSLGYDPNMKCFGYYPLTDIEYGTYLPVQLYWSPGLFGQLGIF